MTGFIVGMGIALVLAPFYDITQWQWWSIAIGALLITGATHF